MENQKFGIDTLRSAVKLFNQCNESFNQRYSANELLQLAAIHARSEWDFYPDQWSTRQVNEALKGIVPQWNQDETPYYSARECRMSQRDDNV